MAVKRLPIFLFSIFVLSHAALSSPPRPAASDSYEDVELYYEWLRAEKRDSTYMRAYRRYRDKGRDKDMKWLSVKAGNGCLLDDYITALLPRENSSTGHDPAPDGQPGRSEIFYEIAEKSLARGERILGLAALSSAFTEAFWNEDEYDKAFYIGFRMEELLPLVSEQDYPDKRSDYYKLGEAYYLFLNERKSIELLEKALSPTPLSFDDTANLDALKILGICYANLGAMDTSDDYFRATLLSGDNVIYRPLYNAYALSHLSCNAMLTGQYDKAMALSSIVWPVLRKTDDYGHLAGMCYCRGKSNLHKGDFREASIWIDSLVYFAHRDQYNQVKRIKQAYRLQSEYYTALGDAQMAKIYSDSLINVYIESEQAYTSQHIARANERYNSGKLSAQSAELRLSRMWIVGLSIAALICIVVGSIITSLYRRKNRAYKVLVRKAQEWASGNRQGATPASDECEAKVGKDCKPDATEEDYRIMKLIEHEMTSALIYRESGLTAESLAERLGVHRNSISRAVNRVTGGNFNLYINGYRIKDAVRMISGTYHSQLRIDELYERVGFSNRTTFYRIFKQLTGLSPIEFQKQKGSSLDK